MAGGGRGVGFYRPLNYGLMRGVGRWLLRFEGRRGVEGMGTIGKGNKQAFFVFFFVMLFVHFARQFKGSFVPVYC